MRLQELIADLGPLKVQGNTDVEVSGIAYDSRRVFPGMVFVALPGRRSDGHEHVYSAVERGACAVVCERNGLKVPRAACVRVSNGRMALARASARFYGRPSETLRVIGVTGTNGKTTVAFLVQHLLQHCGERVGLVTSVRYEVGDRTIPAQRTTPEAVDLQRMLAQMVGLGCKSCVLEVSSHGLAQHRVDEVAFDIGVYTNLTGDHLDYHGSETQYFRAKHRLLEMLVSGAKQAVVLLNVDDSAVGKLARDFSQLRCLTFGLERHADVRGEVVSMGSEGSRVRVSTPSGVAEFGLPLIGRFNVYNALAAMGVGIAAGLDLAEMVRALEIAPQVPGRLERVEVGQPFGVVVDYAHTEDALRNVLGALREITHGRLLLVFGCGGERDPSKRAPMGAAAGRLADEVIVTSDNPRSEPAASIAADVIAGFERGQRAQWKVELDRARAIDGVIRSARAGDTVVVAGKGHESYQEFCDTVVPFDDRLHVLSTLEDLGWHAGRSGPTAPEPGPEGGTD